MLAVMVAPVANVEIDFQFVVTLIAVVIISSFGVAGVGGGATFASIPYYLHLIYQLLSQGY